LILVELSPDYIVYPDPIFEGQNSQKDESEDDNQLSISVDYLNLLAPAFVSMSVRISH